MLLEDLDCWWDPVPRSGPAAMAVDEWLLETATRPLLRVYEWLGRWASIGYFGNWESAQSAIPDRSWVRRRTGGGVVDHADDWTYTLVVPRRYTLAEETGSDRYRLIHEALIEALAVEGIAARFTMERGAADEALCFRNPVPYDLLAEGGKLAGAGQRRTRHGLLHQGSVAGACSGEASRRRTAALASALCPRAVRIELSPSPEGISARSGKYQIPGQDCPPERSHS